MPLSLLLDALRSLYPPERVLTGGAELAAYESDGLTSFRARPAAVVLPETRDEVVQTVRLCHVQGVPFVPRGSGTSLSGGSMPLADGIVIALNRLDRILRIDAEERIAVVEPGAINHRITVATSQHGLLYAPDPSSQSICTIGGNVAFNSGGAHCLRHGMTSNHVLGLEVVLPDGEVLRLGGESLEPIGPDWLGLFVGSEGLLGIALEVTLRLVPEPEAVRTVLATYASLEAAGAAVGRIVADGLLPVAMEIMDELAIQAAASVVSGAPRVAAMLIVELEGERALVDDDGERLDAAIAASGALESRMTDDPVERAEIWKARKSAFSAVGRLAPDYLVQDGVVPRTRLGEALATIEKLSGERGLRVANVFHAGDGNLHPLILFDGAGPGDLGRAEALAGDILRLCVKLGGSITGEHGVGVEKLDHLVELTPPEDVELLCRLRRAVDPAELANRGKALPIAEKTASP